MSPKEIKQSKKAKPSASSAIDWKKSILPILLLAITIFIVFSPALHNQFTNWDDGFYVTSNTDVQKFNIKGMFTKLVTDVYVPLTLLSFAIEYHFVKLNAFVYILNNILLHIAVTLMIFIFARKLGLKERAAFLAALLFGIHPMHVESVAWITERKDVLYASFYMLAVLTYWRYLENQKLGTYVWTVIWGVLSMLAKPMALSLPFVLLVCDWAYGRKFNRSVLLEKWIHFLYMGLLALPTFMAHNARAPMKDFMEGAILWMWSFTFYLKKFFFPFPLLPIYNVPQPIAFGLLEYDIAIIVLIVFIYLMIRNRQNKWVRFAFLFYFASIFFILRMKVEIHVSSVADRFMYLPSVGFCFLVGYFLDEKLNYFKDKVRWKYAAIVGAVILLYCVAAVRTQIQTRIWKDNESLWSLVIKTAPNSTAYNNRGQMYLDRKDYDLAIKDFDAAVSLLRSHYQAYYNKGLAYQELGKYDEALKNYEKAIKYRPNYPPAYHNKSFVYLKLKQYDKAIEAATKGLELKPDVVGMYANRAKAYAYLGKFDEAIRDAQKAKELGHKNSEKLFKEIEEERAKRLAPRPATPQNSIPATK